MINVAKKENKYKNAKFEVADAVSLPFDNDRGSVAKKLLGVVDFRIIVVHY